MFTVIKFVYVKIIFLFLSFFAMNIDGRFLFAMHTDGRRFEGQFQHNWVKPCSLHSDCPDDMCKPSFNPTCIEWMCKCRFIKIEN